MEPQNTQPQLNNDQQSVQSTTPGVDPSAVNNLPQQPANPYQNQNNTMTQPISEESNTIAIVALVLSIIGAGLIGLILGVIGLKKSERLNGKGRGISIAAIIVGVISMILGAIVFLMILLAVPALQHSAQLQQQKIQQQNQQQLQNQSIQSGSSTTTKP